MLPAICLPAVDIIVFLNLLKKSANSETGSRPVSSIIFYMPIMVRVGMKYSAVENVLLCHLNSSSALFGSHKLEWNAFQRTGVK